MKGKDQRTIQFDSTVNRNGIDLEIIVTATVYWSSGMDNAGYESGYMVDDLEAKQAIVSIELTKEEKRDLEAQAVQEYLK